MGDPVTSIPMRKERKAIFNQNLAFLRSLYATYPQLAPVARFNIPDKKEPARPLERTMRATLWPKWYSPPPANPGLRVGVKDLIAEIADRFGLSYSQIVGKSRIRDISRARQTIYAILVRRGSSYAQVGRWLNRDHSSVLHGCSQFEIHSERQPVLRLIYDHYIQDVLEKERREAA